MMLIFLHHGPIQSITDNKAECFREWLPEGEEINIYHNSQPLAFLVFGHKQHKGLKDQEMSWQHV